MIPVAERAKTVYSLERAASVTGSEIYVLLNNHDIFLVKISCPEIFRVASVSACP
jgi:hypothetical protein